MLIMKSCFVSLAKGLVLSREIDCFLHNYVETPVQIGRKQMETENW